MAMDAKDLRIESALGAHSEDGNTKYAQSGTPFQTNGNKQYHDIGSNSLAKVDVPTARPCAIIGPDRVVPPQSTNDAYVKKVPVEPWPCTDTIFQHPPEYPHKPTEYQLSRNISPRQTFQENMQRIMVPPSYASVKNSEDHCLKNSKLMPVESKFCDVPYTISPINNEPKIIKSSEGLVLNNNSNQPMLPHGWASSGVNVRPLRPYGAPDLYQYSEYSNCLGPRPISMIRPHRNIHEDVPQAYQERYHEANIRFKPYPITKERPLQNPHARYDYIPNYPNAFQPHASYPPHKYELPKSIPTHPYSVYPPVHLKYLERRMPVPTMEKYPRSPNQQLNYNQPFSNQNLSTYGALPTNSLQNRGYPYAADPSTKTMMQNRLYFDSNNPRKYYSTSENMFINDMNRPPTVKTDLMYPSYPPINIHSLPPHHMYRKESSMKGYDHGIHYRNIDYSSNINPLGRVPLQFSPQTMSISPSDSIISNDTTQIHPNAQEDCGYASQSSTASIRSIESGVNRISNDMYRRNDILLSQMNKFGQKSDTNTSSKDKKSLDVRQFLQMWNEGDEEGNDNKETTKQRDPSNPLGHYESGNNQEQLYVLGLVNVPKEELGKYDHIQKISKLPENIKGYNSIELLNQYEKLVESPDLNNFSLTQSKLQQKDLHVPIRNSFPKHGMEVSNVSARPLSPLDVEAKISQSVIHKEVGCNFEIRPCSPQMMNVELATPVHNVLGERLIEKVVNPVKTKSPICQRIEETNNISSSRNATKVPSCKMVNIQYPSPHVNDTLKTNYSLQDLESNSGVCLASLPRLDNDIELNFPEINQQFINDNKISSIRDLPLLDTEINRNVHKNKVLNPPFITEHSNSVSESEKDVSKLSKYRKQKRNSVPNDSDDTLSISLHRTDSVIIKNPDNVKSQDEHINVISLNNNNTPIIENISNRINITVENDNAVNCSDDKKLGIIHENFIDYKSIDSNTAIDFSLNKCDDAQSTSINSASNLNDILKNDIAIDKNTSINNEFININNNSNKEIPKPLDEIATSDNYSVLQPKSSTLENNLCSKEPSINIVLQSIDKNNHDLQTHDTVITHSKSTETVSDISLISISSFTEEIVSHNELPSLSNNENTSTIPNACDSNIPEDIAELSTDIKNQALNYCFNKNSEDLITPVCELTYNLDVKNQKDQDIIKDVIEGNPCTQEDENNTLNQENVHISGLQTHSDTNLKNNEDDSLAIPEIRDEIFKNEYNKDKLNNERNELSNSETSREQDRKVIDFKSIEYVDIINKCSNENPIEEAGVDVNNMDCNKPSNSNDLISVSTNDFNSTNTPCTEIEILKNDDLIFKTKSRNMPLSLSSLNEIWNTQSIESGAESHRTTSHEFTFNKELFSPRIQNLLIYNEGLCTIVTRYENKNTEEVNSELTIKPLFEDETVNVEFENNLNSHIINGKNDRTSLVTLDNLTEIVKNVSTTVANKLSSSEIVDIEVCEVDEKVIEGKDRIITENPVENCDSSSIIELDQKEIDTALENKIEINDKIDNDVEEKNALSLLWNQFPNKPKRILKRSLSESAVAEYTTTAVGTKACDNNFIFGRKRPKVADSEILVESQVITENFASFIQSNRRNSVSTIYNDENVSFCILIDNDCVLTEENESCQKICYTEIPDECLATLCTEEDALNSELTENISYGSTTEICSAEEAVDSELTTDIYIEDNTLISDKEENVHFELDSENSPYEKPEEGPCNNDLILRNVENRTIEETWVEDVACMETIFSDDIAEDIVISAPSSPKDSISSEDESDNSNIVYNINENEHTNKVKNIYGSKMCDLDAELVEKLYRTPQMNVNKTLIDRESQLSQDYNRYYDNESLEKILSESNTLDTHCLLVHNDSASDKSLGFLNTVKIDDVHGNKENLKDIFPEQENRSDMYSEVDLPDLVQPKLSEDRKSNEYDDCLIHSCESSCDNFVSYKREEKLQYAISRSPEVSSTTSEEKGPAILLKIRSYKGSKISEVNEMSAGYNHPHSQRPLITKAAQKYIPPLKESIHDLKVKIRLPKQSLYKLQQLKKSKEKPKIPSTCSKLYIKKISHDSPKAKPKPKFEDVLMSIDEIHLKKHKTKLKKNKQSVPKVIIKKNENGAHYASTQTKEMFNPDLTGRKWQPWVFIEKSNFVDKMALKQKFKAIYSHRKKTFVLAENFRKYKSISNAKFVISHPNSSDNISTGNLKYTFRLTHS